MAESKARVIDLAEAWRRRGRHVPVPAPAVEHESSTVGAKARVRGRQLTVDVYTADMEPLGKLVFSPELARDWSRYFAAFAARCEREDAVRKRVAEGLCGSPSCKRKLVVGTERCRKCSQQIAARGEASPHG